MSFAVVSVRTEETDFPVAHEHITEVTLKNGASESNTRVAAQIADGRQYTLLDTRALLQVHPCPECVAPDYLRVGRGRRNKLLGLPQA